jgi:NADP-dependent 3-hydroxy acid dehydrogenase YdfG
MVKIDAFWNNAGIMPISFFEEGSVDQWDKMIDANIKGVLYGINAALPHMLKQAKDISWPLLPSGA